jgi:hypothetical protein
MAVNIPWKELWEALKNDPLYHLEGFAERCIEELESDTPAEYQYLDDIKGPQAHLLHLLCDLGDLARLDNGEGKRDDAEQLQYQVDPDYAFPFYDTFFWWEWPDDWDYSLYSALVGEPIFMVDLDALKVFLRAERLPLPHECFGSEPDATDEIEKLYREKSGDRPIYLDDVRELLEIDSAKRMANENATGSSAETPEEMAERLRERYGILDKFERRAIMAKELDEAFPCPVGQKTKPLISNAHMGRLVADPNKLLSWEGYKSKGKDARKRAKGLSSQA